MKRLVALGALALVTACGAVDDTAVSKAIADSLVGSAPLKTIGLDLTTEQGDCVGDAWVAEIGTEELVGYGLVSTNGETPAGSSGMSDEDAAKAARALGTCVPLKPAIASVFATQGGFTPDQAACVEGTLDDAEVEAVFAAVLADKAPDMARMLEQATTCLV